MIELSYLHSLDDFDNVRDLTITDVDSDLKKNMENRPTSLSKKL